MGAALQGAFSTAAVQVATTWGTAVAAGAGDRFAAEISAAPSVDVLQNRNIGSGRFMAGTFVRGSTQYTVSLTADLGYRNNCDVLLAALMGTSGAPTEVTASQGDWLHTITFNTAPTRFVTLAYESASANVHEFPTCVPTEVTISSTSIPGYVDFGMTLLANDMILSTAVNTNAVLTATTYTEGTPELVAVDQIDTHWQNNQSGLTLAAGDSLPITSFEFGLQRPYELIPEIKGSAGFSAPSMNGLVTGTFTVQLKEQADHTHWTIWTGETARKARLRIEGTQIGTGSNKRFTILMPRLLMVNPPDFSLSSDGRNPVTLTYNLAQAATNPTGMSNTYPHFEFINTFATTLLP